MRLSWNEIRARAAQFAQEWQDAGYEKGQTQLFYRDFFEVFGVPVRRVAAFEEPVTLLGDRRGFIDLFWKGVLLVEQKSVGRDLTKAKAQAFSYFPGLKDADLPSHLLLSDFQSFELHDLEEDRRIAFALADLPQHVEEFGFILGVQKRTFRDQDPVNIAASERVGHLHDALAASGYTGHDLQQFLVRMVFCFFADDTGIFEPRDIELRDEFRCLQARRDSRRIPELIAFQQRLGQLRFFDPACGCGNFLIIAYRKLRALEIEVLKEIRPHGQLDVLAELLSVVDVDQFYGIELGEFPAHIAEVALWMMDHIMNNRLSLEFGQTYTRIPLAKSPHIRHGDALEIDWGEVLPPAECSYVLGNPPFVGAKFQSTEQRGQVRRIAALGKSGGTLDYVTAWFIKAGEYAKQGTVPIGFVATNSITQGEQVAQLWPILFDRCALEIAFAHRTFAWGSDARGMAHVHVVIVGLAKRSNVPKAKRLFSYDDPKGEPSESQHAALSPYLFDAGGLAAPRIVVKEAAQPLNELPKMIMGSQPIEGGYYIFNADQRAAFLDEEPGAEPYLRPFVGSREFLQGGERWILRLAEVPPQVLRTLPKVRERIAAVRAYRLASKRKSTRELAATPMLYQANIVPDAPFLVVPEVSSERRDYIPIAWLEPPVIPSNKVRILPNAELWQFGLLTSTMHMAWVRIIGGRLESRYSYGIGVIYNTFPLPPVPANRLQRLAPYADAILAARAAHPDATLSDLYDPDLMPADLRKAHQALDRAVDRLYRRTAFPTDHDRVEHLLGLYEKMLVPLTAKPKRRRRS